MDFKQIEAFVSVAKNKSFSKGAEKIFLTQPTVSSHISSLEKELKVTLLKRNGREVTLTEEGKIFLKYAEELLSLRSKAVQNLQEFTGKISGNLVISASTIPSYYILPDIISSFKEKYKDVNFHVRTGDSKMVTKNLLEETCEIGFAGAQLEKKLSYEEITMDELVFIAANNQRFSDIGEEIEIRELLKLPFIIRESGSGTREIFEKGLKELGISISQLNITMEMDNLEGIKEAVKKGLGITVLSKFAVKDELEYNKIKTFKIKEANFQRYIYLVTNPKNSLTPIAKAFREHVISIYKKGG